MPPLRVWPGLLPLARHYSSRKYNIVFLLGINIISLRRNCCLIVDSFEKNYREKKTRQGDKETGRREDRETGTPLSGAISCKLVIRAFLPPSGLDRRRRRSLSP